MCMFYGRVDVYWPDGPVESYRLNKATIAVGRSTGNDIVLDTTAISRYHITLRFEENQALLEDLDSANGTYVDGVRLRPHDPFALRGGEEVQIGDIRLIFHPPGSTGVSSEDTTQRVILAKPNYRVELDGPDIAVAPGAHTQARLTIENTGDAADRYFIEIDGLPKGWTRVDRVELELAPGETGQVVISFKPLRRSETRPGDHPFIVRVRSKSAPAETVDVPTALQVLPYSGFGMALGETLVSDGQRFTLYVHNQGNAPLPLDLYGTDPSHALRFQLSTPHIELAPGERQTLLGGIRPRRRPVFGSERKREFAVVARSKDPSGFVATVPGVYVERGLLPAWLPVLIVPFIVLGVLLVAGFVSVVLDRAGDSTVAPPVIAAFDISDRSVSLGEVVAATWQVTGADSLVLEWGNIAGLDQVQLDPNDTSHTLVFDDTGHYDLTLKAGYRGATVSSTVTVEVRPVVTLAVAVADGTELVRNVTQDVQVTWTVGGARRIDRAYSVWVKSSDRTDYLLAPPLPLVGQQTVVVRPSGDQAEWLVTLTAEGRDGILSSITQKVPIVYPVCELVAGKTIVRSGPGESYPAILPPQPPDDAPEGVLSYSPLARDPGGEWLQVTIGVDSRPGWVPLADFVCTNFDPQRLIVTREYAPPPPSITPSPPVEMEASDEPDATAISRPAARTPTPTPQPIG